MFVSERRSPLRSSTQLGIYRDLDDLDLEKRSRLRCRLRCCAITAFAALSAFLVSITLVQLAGANTVVQLTETKENRTTDLDEKNKINFNVTESTLLGVELPENISATSILSTEMRDDSEHFEGSDEVTSLTHSAVGFESKINISDSASSTEDVLSADAIINHNLDYLKQNKTADPDHTNRRQKSLFAERRSSHGDFPYPFENFDFDSGGAYASDIIDRVMTRQPRPFIPRPRPHTKTTHGIRHSISSNVAAGSSTREQRLRPYNPSYQYPNDANNIQDIIQYLNSDSQIAEHRHKHRSPNSPNIFLGHSPHRKAVKFAGVYLHPHGDNDQESGSATVDESVVATENASPNSLNGHAYVSDPFVAYKPDDPSDVNLLASSPSEELSRHQVLAQYDDETNISEDKYKYFPRPPISFEKPPSATTSAPFSTSTELYTSAIYRPLGHDNKSPKQKPRTKPFSIMLDIYPMTEPTGPAGYADRPVAPTMKPRGRNPPRNNRMKPMRNRPRTPPGYADSKHQMVVHLNLYPKKKQRASARNDDTNERSMDFDLNARENSEGTQEFDSEINYFCNKSVNVALALENSGNEIKGLRIFQDGEEILPDYHPNESDYESEDDRDSDDFRTHTYISQPSHQLSSRNRQSLAIPDASRTTANVGSDMSEKPSHFNILRRKPQPSLTLTHQFVSPKQTTTEITKKNHLSDNYYDRIRTDSWNTKYSIPRTVVPTNHKDRFEEATYMFEEKPEVDSYFSLGEENADQDKQLFTSAGDYVTSDFLWDSSVSNNTHPLHETHYF